MLLHSTVQLPGFCMTFTLKNTDPELEKARIITTAAQFIKNDINAMKQSKDLYPYKAEMPLSTATLECIPDYLKSFLRSVYAGKDVDVKRASLRQAIMQAARPRILLAPLQIGLGVQMHYHFQSKFLTESLNSHGFCCYCDEVKVESYDRSAVILPGMIADVDEMQNPGSCTVECNNIWFPIYFCYDNPIPKVFQQLALHVGEAVGYGSQFSSAMPVRI